MPEVSSHLLFQPAERLLSGVSFRQRWEGPESDGNKPNYSVGYPDRNSNDAVPMQDSIERIHRYPVVARVPREADFYYAPLAAMNLQLYSGRVVRRSTDRSGCHKSVT